MTTTLHAMVYPYLDTRGDKIGCGEVLLFLLTDNEIFEGNRD